MGTDLNTNPTARAKSLIDPDGLLFSPRLQGRAFKLLDAKTAPLALFSDVNRLSHPGFGLAAIHQAGALGNHYRHTALFGASMPPGFLEQLNHGAQAVGILFGHESDAAGADELRNGNLRNKCTIERLSERRCGLMAGHGSGAVVKDHEHEARSLSNGVDQSRDAGMKESGIADGGAQRRRILRAAA